MIRNGQTPQDTSRLVDLDVLLGNRGLEGARAVRLRELPNFMDQAIAFALANRGAPKSASAALTADVAAPTASAWVSGPSVSLSKGVWSITAMALIKTGDAGIIAARVHNGTDALLAMQASHPATADYFTTLHLAGVITVPGAATITLQSAPSITSATISMIAQTTIGGATDATRISAVQIGA